MGNVELTGLPPKKIGGDTKILAFDSGSIGTATAIDILKMRSVAENVFPVLRLSSAAGKFGTPEYDAQLAQALAKIAPFPSIYAARDAAFAWANGNPKTACIVIMAGHYESVSAENPDADRYFSNSVISKYGSEEVKGEAAPFVNWKRDWNGEYDKNTSFVPVVHAESPMSASLAVHGITYIAERGTQITFEGVKWAYLTPEMKCAFYFDSVHSVSSGVENYGDLEFNANTYTGNGYWNFMIYSRLFKCRIGYADFTGHLMVLRSCESEMAMDKTRGKIVFVVNDCKHVTDEIEPTTIYRCSNADILIKVAAVNKVKIWNANYLNGVRLSNVVRNNTIRYDLNFETLSDGGSRPQWFGGENDEAFTGNEIYVNGCIKSTAEKITTWGESNRYFIEGQMCGIEGSGAVYLGARVYGDITTENIAVLSSASTTNENSLGVPVFKFNLK